MTELKNIVLASSSSLYSSGYLNYLKSVLKDELFCGIKEILFLPYARPGGISCENYTLQATTFFKQLGIKVKSPEDFTDPVTALKQAQGIYTGGGNTFLLLRTLQLKSMVSVLKDIVENGTPYLGTSAGSNIGGLSIQTTNDMPICLPESLHAMRWVPFNINPHYIEPDQTSTHMGETREMRIRELQVYEKIPVVGLPEGSWLRIKGSTILLEGQCAARIFPPDEPSYWLNPGKSVCFG